MPQPHLIRRSSLRLKTFGCLTLNDDLGSVVAIQRRRLALLALLAQAGDRGLTRDKLVGFLWAESTLENARHSLEQVLYGTRRQLGDEVFAGSDPLRLNPRVISTDVMEFEVAIDQGALAEATSLYRGIFLDGFYLDGAGEFESWMERERRRLAGRYANALEQLAQQATSSGQRAIAIGWWRKLNAAEPLSARATVGLMRALATAGDRPAALRHALEYEVLVRDELDSSPDPTVLTLVEELRAAPVSPASRTNRAVPAGLSPPVSSPAHPGGEPSRTREVPRLALGLPLLLILGVALAVSSQKRSAPITHPGSAVRHIAIAPFRVANPDTSFQNLGEGIAGLLAARFTGEGGPSAVDARRTLSAWRGTSTDPAHDGGVSGLRLAQMVGAEQILEGEATRTGQELRLSATVRSAADGNVAAHASVRGPASQMVSLVDRLAASLLMHLAGEREDRFALLTNTSLPALRAYLAGRASYRHGDNAEAVAQFGRALDLDPSLAPAGLELAAATGWIFAWAATRDSAIRAYHLPLDRGGIRQALPFQGQWVRGIDVAWRNRQRLSKPDLVYLVALRGGHYPEPGLATDRLWDWEHAVEAAPDRADAWYRLGYILLYQGTALGFNDASQRAAAAFHRALELDSGFVQPRAGLLEVAGRQHDTAGVRLLGAQYLARDSVSQNADYVRWHVAAVLDDATALSAIRTRFDSLDPETLDRIQWTSQVEGIDLDDAGRAMDLLVRQAGETDERIFALFSASMLAINTGHPTEALRIARAQAEAEQEMGGYWHYRLLYALFWDSDTTAGADAVKALEPEVARGLAGERGKETQIWQLLLWHAWHGDTGNASRTIQVLESRSDRRAVVAAAILANLRKTPDAAPILARADSLTLRGCCSWPHYANSILARVHERAGDPSGALAAIRRQEGLYPPEYLSASLREEGRLAGLTGDREGAIRAYRHYLALRSNPDPELQPEAAQVRRELERLQRVN